MQVHKGFGLFVLCSIGVACRAIEAVGGRRARPNKPRAHCSARDILTVDGKAGLEKIFDHARMYYAPELLFICSIGDKVVVVAAAA